MDKQTYQQIDRIEAKTDKIIEGIGLILTIDNTETITDFIQKEIYQEKGRLTHLAGDRKLQEIYEQLKGQQEENEQQEEEEDEYTQNGKTI